MGNSYGKYLELKESGAFEFDPTNVTQVLYKAADSGLKSQVLYEAMDFIRENPELTNDGAILLAAKKLKLI